MAKSPFGVKSRSGVLPVLRFLGPILLFVSFVLLLIPSISAPTVCGIALFHETYDPDYGTTPDNSTTINSTGFNCIRMNRGALGNCAYNCTDGKMVGRDEPHAGYHYASNSTTDVYKNPSKAFVLFPIACGLTFIAFLLALSALSAGIIGAVFSVIVALMAWVAAVMILIIVFASFAHCPLRSDGYCNRLPSRRFGAATWSALAGAITLCSGMVIALVSYWKEKREKRRTKDLQRTSGMEQTQWTSPAPPTMVTQAQNGGLEPRVVAVAGPGQ